MAAQTPFQRELPVGGMEAEGRGEFGLEAFRLNMFTVGRNGYGPLQPWSNDGCSQRSITLFDAIGKQRWYRVYTPSCLSFQDELEGVLFAQDISLQEGFT